ncbi:F-box/FBD/LRR-repeat protein At2g04230-like [Cynara cardunculus var. scolymus]|uniref:F-box/FBD/LRR-repeat protein At2g04230-like n=1 Tax=Cynara cardunculus var. scolymus TaxID=59895 RepID=UPI000D62C7AA|nr:F-box/FBD/LRR-repeat protein At2g04230-like [Cynara cardunculus var. scolymus]
MAASTTTTKNMLEEENMARIEEDRLNDLPKSLHRHILSLLHTKDAVQTSMISKSWLRLWTSIPVLHLNSCNFRYVVNFDKFVNSVLRYRDESAELNTLTFSRRGACSAKIVKEVVDYAFSHGVNHLELFIKRFKNDSLPVCEQTSSDSLKTLKLKIHSYVSCPLLSGSFKNLTFLYLKGAIIKNHQPFSGFPMLEKLVLKDCRLGKVLSVQAPKLCDLTISCRGCFDRCELTTPNLRFFKYMGSDFPLLVTRDGLPVLETVVIDYYGVCYDFEEQRLFDDLISLFWALDNAKSLTIFSTIVDVLNLFPDDLVNRNSPFCKLKCLNLDLKYLGMYENLFDSLLPRRRLNMKRSYELVKAYLLNKSPEAKFSIIPPPDNDI